MHWETLGLDSETASERDVKRAYAKLLKVTRPDKDPEGFQNLREAYDTALMELKLGTMPSFVHYADDEEGEGSLKVELPEGIDAETEPSVPQSFAQPEWPEDFRSAVSELEEVMESGQNAEEACRAFENALYANPQLAADWGQTVARLMMDQEGSKELKLKAKALLFELEYDSSTGTMAVIARMEREGRRAGISSLAVLFIKNKERIANPSGGEAMARLGCAAAIWEPIRVKFLSDIAYELLPIHFRDSAMHAIENDVQLGQLLRGLPKVWRPFWMERIRNPYGDWDWNDVESSAALKYIREEHNRTWDGFDVIAEIVPKEFSNSIPKRNRVPSQPMYGYSEKAAPAAPSYAPAAPSYAPAAPYRESRGGGGMSGWMIGLLIFFIIKIGILATMCKSDQSVSLPNSNPAYDPDNYPGRSENDPGMEAALERFRELEAKYSASPDDPPKSASDLWEELRKNRNPNPLFPNPNPNPRPSPGSGRRPSDPYVPGQPVIPGSGNPRPRPGPSFPR